MKKNLLLLKDSLKIIKYKLKIKIINTLPNKYNNTNSTIKMTPIDVKSSTRIDSSKEIK